MAKQHKNPAHLSVLDRVTDQWRANLAKVGLFSIEIEAWHPSTGHMNRDSKDTVHLMAYNMVLIYSCSLIL
jgi:hypothetical protein